MRIRSLCVAATTVLLVSARPGKCQGRVDVTRCQEPARVSGVAGAVDTVPAAETGGRIGLGVAPRRGHGRARIPEVPRGTGLETGGLWCCGTGLQTGGWGTPVWRPVPQGRKTVDQLREESNH